jgi:hypothetical protein
MAADETDGEADWLGKSLQTLTASLTVQDYRFINSATALGVSETGIMSEDVCKKDAKADFNCVRYSFPRTVLVNASAPYEDVRRWLVRTWHCGEGSTVVASRFPRHLFPQIADKQRTMEAKLQHRFLSIFSLDFMWNNQFQRRTITKCWRDKVKRLIAGS